MDMNNFNTELPLHHHHEHRTMDVTSSEHLHPRRLCLDCHVEFEEPRAERDNNWLNQQWAA